MMDAAEAVGASVLDIADLGAGAGDILVGFRGVNFLIEVKDDKQPPSKRRLTPDEQEFHLLWTGQIDVCKNVDELLLLLGVLHQKRD